MSTHSSPGSTTRTLLAGACALLLAALVAAASPVLAAEKRQAATRMSAAQIAARHVAARGGLEAWRSVQTLQLKGKMDAGAGDSLSRSVRIARGPGAVQRARREVAAGAAAGKSEAPSQLQVPFTLARQRPNKSRLEVEFAGKTAVQVYDGVSGWKVRPFLNNHEVKPFTPEETKAEAEGASLDGPLFDYAAKGKTLALEGVEKVEGRDAYKLKLTATKTGAVQRVWIDAQTFLDVKVEGVPRRLDGKLHGVWVLQRDFRKVQGLVVPFALETVVEGFPQTHKIVLDKVAVNPKVDAAAFAKPKA